MPRRAERLAMRYKLILAKQYEGVDDPAHPDPTLIRQSDGTFLAIQQNEFECGPSVAEDIRANMDEFIGKYVANYM